MSYKKAQPETDSSVKPCSGQLVDTSHQSQRIPSLFAGSNLMANLNNLSRSQNGYTRSGAMPWNMTYLRLVNCCFERWYDIHACLTRSFSRVSPISGGIQHNDISLFPSRYSVLITLSVLPLTLLQATQGYFSVVDTLLQKGYLCLYIFVTV